MAKFSMYYSSAFETKPGWLAVTMARISKFCLNIIGISFALWSQDYLSFFRFSGAESCTGAMENSTLAEASGQGGRMPTQILA